MATGKVLGGGILLGIAVGIGAAVIGPALWRLGRPMAKDAIKAGVAGYGAARLAMARASEEVEDLVAEASYELAQAAASAPEAQETPGGVIVRG